MLLMPIARVRFEGACKEFRTYRTLRGLPELELKRSADPTQARSRMEDNRDVI